LLGEKGFFSLKKLPEKFYPSINMVIIGTDRKMEKDFSIEIKFFCQNKSLSYIVQNNTFVSEGHKFSIAIGWRWLINDGRSLIVFHDSLLPKLRGFNPLVTSLINGQKHIGLTVLEGNKDFDRGDIILQRIISISYPIKINYAINLISKLYAELLEEVFDLILVGNIKSYKQNNSLATYSLWRDEEDYRIDWSKSALEIKRFIDAVGYPYLGAKTLYQDTLLTIKDADVDKDVVIENRCPGKVIFKDEESFSIVCGKGILKVKDFFNTNGEIIKIKNFRIRFK
jgi:methionyl-tRNA formyltransferase